MDVAQDFNPRNIREMHVVHDDMPLDSSQLNSLFRAALFRLIENLKQPVDGDRRRLDLLIDAVERGDRTNQLAQDEYKRRQLTGCDDTGKDEIAAGAEYDEGGNCLNDANNKIGFGE